MILTFKLDIYRQLVSQHQPQIIMTEEENEKFLDTVEKLLSRSHLTPEEDALLELLVKLIEDFEDKHYQLDSSTPYSRLLHLMEARGLEQADLVEILGSSEIVTKIMNSELEITKKQAEALGKFFHVEPSLFIC
ncbi:MAG: transcriptional regulator [Nostoc desertorum CM1-VF14]|jgi:HTH-type transcriptional regulator/antitoxin HigA|nr:transcriptional regulator [Nostoc desertorum CM1-VF14]